MLSNSVSDVSTSYYMSSSLTWLLLCLVEWVLRWDILEALPFLDIGLELYFSICVLLMYSISFSLLLLSLITYSPSYFNCFFSFAILLSLSSIIWLHCFNCFRALRINSTRSCLGNDISIDSSDVLLFRPSSNTLLLMFSLCGKKRGLMSSDVSNLLDDYWMDDRFAAKMLWYFCPLCEPLLRRPGPTVKQLVISLTVSKDWEVYSLSLCIPSKCESLIFQIIQWSKELSWILVWVHQTYRFIRSVPHPIQRVYKFISWSPTRTRFWLPTRWQLLKFISSTLV